MMQDSRIVSIKVEYKVVCALSNGDSAHNFEYPQPPHFLHFVPPFIAW